VRHNPVYPDQNDKITRRTFLSITGLLSGECIYYLRAEGR